MEQKKKNVVVIGYGGMGAWHADNLLHSDCANLKGVYDIQPSRCQAAKEKGIFAYDSFEAVLADKDVDLVTLAVPNDVHKPLAIEAMKHGINVISEKPVTLSSADLQEMIDASEKYGKLFTVHQNRRWDGDFLLLRDIYHNGKIGEVFTVESRVFGSRGIPGDWRKEKEHGGGMMLDWGVHLIDQMLCLIDDRKLLKVFCRCEHIANAEVDDGFHLELFFDNDVMARIEVGTNHFLSLPRFYMAGVDGTAMITDWWSPCRVVYCTDRSIKDAVPVRTAAGLTKTMAPRDERSTATEELQNVTSDVHDFYRNICATLDGRETQIVTHKQMMRVMRVMEAAFLSDQLGQVVEFDDSDR